jgi:predicted DNA-binding transcriptional regulator AlpA
MACRSRAENSNRNPVPRVSWTIDEFCASVGISRSTYEKAKREGWGPREMVLGSTGIRITDEARAEWIASREKAATVAAKRRERPRGSEKW